MLNTLFTYFRLDTMFGCGSGGKPVLRVFQASVDRSAVPDAAASTPRFRLFTMNNVLSNDT